MYFQSLGPNSLIKQALYYRKTSMSFKSSLSIVYQCRTSQLSFPLFLVSHQHCFSMDSIHMSPLDRPQWPQVRVSPQTIKMVRGLGLRSQVMERMRAVGLLRLKLWTESKLAERLETVLRTLELRDVVLTCGFCGHVLNVHADYILMRRTETRWERGYMMTLMSFSSFPRKLKA